MGRASSLSVFTLALSAGFAPAAFGDIIVGSGTGIPTTVQVFGPAGPGGAPFNPYGPSFLGGVRVAAGDINRDGSPDIITGAGSGAPGGHVKVFDGNTGAEIRSFFAFDGFLGGVHVAAGDINGDGRADVITGAGAGSVGGHVKVFDGQTGGLARSFFAFDGFSGGVRVAGGDVNHDGIADIITGAGAGSPGGHVKVFSGADGSLIRSFLSYDSGFAGGVFVASGDVDGDGFADIVTGTGDDDTPTAASHVKVFSGMDGSLLASFLAYDGFSGGVRVAAGDVNGDGLAEIVTGSGPGAGPHVKVFSGVGGQQLSEFFPLSTNFLGGVYVAAIPAPGAAGVLLLPAMHLALRRRRAAR